MKDKIWFLRWHILRLVFTILSFTFLVSMLVIYAGGNRIGLFVGGGFCIGLAYGDIDRFLYKKGKKEIDGHNKQIK